MDIQTREVFISRNVIFYESFFGKFHNRIDQAVTQEDDDFTRITYDDAYIQRGYTYMPKKICYRHFD